MTIKGAPTIGQLRTRVEIKQPVQDEHGSRGELANDPITVGDAKVFLRELRGNDAIQSRMMVPTATHEIWMRYRCDLTMTTDKFLTVSGTTRSIYIGSVDNVEERNLWLKMLGGEVKP